MIHLRPLKPNPAPWDFPGVVETLKAEWLAGKSPREIAAQLQRDGFKVTRNSVIGKADRLNLPRRDGDFKPRKSVLAKERRDRISQRKWGAGA